MVWVWMSTELSTNLTGSVKTGQICTEVVKVVDLMDLSDFEI